jgi:hypothetical protein
MTRRRGTRGLPLIFKGDFELVYFASANRDEAEFEHSPYREHSRHHLVDEIVIGR